MPRPLVRSRPLATAALAVGCLAAFGCADPVAPRAEAALTALPRSLTEAEREIVAGSNGFAFSLLRTIAAGVRPDSNLFVSPLSVSMALGMTMNGTAGETQRQFRETLGFGATPLDSIDRAYGALIGLLRSVDRGVDFRIANSVWAGDDFQVRPAFLATVREHFGAEARTVSFRDPATATAINDWVKAATNGKIPKMLEGVDPQTVMYLINAIYFKGSWRSRFDPAATASRPFTDALGATASVPAMRQSFRFAYARRPGLQAIDLPYGRGAFTMTVLLPDSGVTADAMLAELTPERWLAMTAFGDSADVDLQLPKFTLTDAHRLDAPLQAMGIRDAFQAGLADFSPLSPEPGLEISEVLHKTFVDVNEEGTEAAAATSVGIIRTSLPQRVAFVVDRPFVFVLRERFSGAILFVGRIAKL